MYAGPADVNRPQAPGGAMSRDYPVAIESREPGLVALYLRRPAAFRAGLPNKDAPAPGAKMKNRIIPAAALISALACNMGAQAQDHLRASIRGYELQVARGAANIKHYPAEAMSRGEEGSALVEARIGGDGRLAEARVTGSSGHALLDQEALRTLRAAVAEVAVPPELAGQVFGARLRIVFALPVTASPVPAAPPRAPPPSASPRAGQ